MHFAINFTEFNELSEKFSRTFSITIQRSSQYAALHGFSP